MVKYYLLLLLFTSQSIFCTFWWTATFFRDLPWISEKFLFSTHSSTAAVCRSAEWRICHVLSPYLFLSYFQSAWHCWEWASEAVSQSLTVNERERVRVSKWVSEWVSEWVRVTDNAIHFSLVTNTASKGKELDASAAVGRNAGSSWLLPVQTTSRDGTCPQLSWLSVEWPAITGKGGVIWEV